MERPMIKHGRVSAETKGTDVHEFIADANTTKNKACVRKDGVQTTCFPSPTNPEYAPL
jgi:hypothetical protein